MHVNVQESLCRVAALLHRTRSNVSELISTYLKKLVFENPVKAEALLTEGKAVCPHVLLIVKDVYHSLLLVEKPLSPRLLVFHSLLLICWLERSHI